MSNIMHRLDSSSSDENFKLSCDAVLATIVRLDQSSIDAILAHNNPEQANIILPDGRQFMWYFAFGSMVNPISLYLRELTPIVSFPARCLNHRIAFPGVNGMADIEPSPEDELHGVVHLFSEEHMACLDRIEMMYQRVTIDVIDYQNQPHVAYIYKMNINDQQANLPTERYLDIIVKGCEYYKVQPEYINRLKTEQPIMPRKQPHTFQSFSDIPSDVFYSVDELARHNGTDPALPLWMTVNGKILEYAGVPANDHPDHAVQKSFYAFIQPKFGGCEAVHTMAKLLYEPLYKLPLNYEDMCAEHRAQIEDHYVNMVAKYERHKTYWKPIGRVLPPGNSS